MMDTVYLVTDGCYSDYRVLAAFSARKAAEEYRRALDSSYAEVEAFAVDISPSEWYGITVEMFRDGTVGGISEKSTQRPFALNGRRMPSVSQRYRGVRMPDGSTPDGSPRLELCLIHTVFTSDPEHAIKVTNELRTRLVAEGRWHEGHVEA